MAEVYGEKPKIFTKEWWPYFWLYYKWHTVAFLFVAVLVVMGISDCMKREDYDLRIATLSKVYFGSTALDKIENALEAEINDIDGNEEKNIDIMSLVFIDDKEYADQNYAAYIKHDSEFSDPIMQAFIYDRAELEQKDKEGLLQIAFCKTDDWLESEVSDDMIFYDGGGNPYAVSLKNSSILMEAGINGEDLFVLVKNDAEAHEKNPKANKNAVIAANNLIK